MKPVATGGFLDQDMAAQWRKLQVIIFSKKCCLYATRRRQAILGILRRKRVGEVSDPYDASGPARGEPAMVMSEQPNPLPQIKAPVAAATRTVH